MIPATPEQRERIWEAMVRDNANLDGVLTVAMSNLMPVFAEMLADAEARGRASCDENAATDKGLPAWSPTLGPDA